MAGKTRQMERKQMMYRRENIEIKETKRNERNRSWRPVINKLDIDHWIPMK